MSIKIDSSKCVGCSKCVEVCPGNLIKLSAEKKAFIRYERDCWGCTSCVKECARSAISFYLGADIGGRGSHLTVKTEGTVRIWKIKTHDGSTKEIRVDSSDANKY